MSLGVGGHVCVAYLEVNSRSGLSVMHLLNFQQSHHAIVSYLRGTGRWGVIGKGRTGTYVLAKSSNSRVCKLGDDAGLTEFVNFLSQQQWVSCLPRIYGVAKGTGQPSWTGLWCEQLAPLLPAQQSSWSKWANHWMTSRGVPQTDPFGVANCLASLSSFASSKGLGLDILNPDNVMCRPGTGELVFSDPLV